MTTAAPAKPAAPPREANICNGSGVLALPTETGWHYPACPGCVGCDYDMVSARVAAKAPSDPFALLPCDDDSEW